MKAIWILSFSILIIINCNSQELGGISLQDYLSTVTHPECDQNSNRYIIGPPNDSIWVNLIPGIVLEGPFNYSWINGIGDDLMLETGYHESVYSVRLILVDGSFSLTHNVVEGDWILLTDTVLWNHAYSIAGNCEEVNSTSGITQYITTLDFEQDFGLQSTDIVIGIEVNFLQTPGIADLAGVYITEFAMPCNPVNLGEDITICSDETVLIDAGSYNSYYWNDGSADPALLIDGSLIDQGIHSYSVEVIDNNGCYSKDSINITVEICSNIKEVNKNLKVLVYPNPANDFLNLSIADEVYKSEVEIFSYNGRIIEKFTTSKKITRIDISAYPKGIYFGKLGEFYFKFIKE